MIVACHFNESQSYYAQSPVIIVEVLSKAARKTDETVKLLSYINISSLQEYVLIEQDYVDIQDTARELGISPSAVISEIKKRPRP